MQRYTRSKSIKDAIYDYIDVDPFALRIIDTPEFQGLRELRQLGVVHYVYPSANHTRFEHSLGVYHLAGKMIEALVQNTPGLRITERQTQLIKIGALVHDLGHLVCSHLFDHYIAPKVSKIFRDHEARSEYMFRNMVTKYKLQMTQSEVDYVCDILRGRRTAGIPRWMFQIVANSDFYFDVDKCDYIMRDSFHIGMSNPLQLNRILRNMKVINETVCFSKKIYMLLADVFIYRYRLHREVYRHHAVVAIELMAVDVLKIIATKQDWKTWFDKPVDPVEWRRISDWLLDCTWDNAPARAQDIMYRIKTRQLYRMVDKTEPDAIIVHNNLGYTSGSSNPMDKILFYDSNNNTSTLHASTVSQLLPVNSNETVVLAYSTKPLVPELKVPEKSIKMNIRVQDPVYTDWDSF